MAVNVGSWCAMCKCTVWWVATNILEEPATSIILQNFGSRPPYCAALHSKTRVLEFLPFGASRCCDCGMGGFENILHWVPKD